MQFLTVWKSLKFVVWERVRQSTALIGYHTIMTLNDRPSENIVGKGENAGNYRSCKNVQFFSHILFCHLQMVLNLVQFKNLLFGKDLADHCSDTTSLCNPITRRQILDSSKLKKFADDNFKFDKNGRSYPNR